MNPMFCLLKIVRFFSDREKKSSPSSQTFPDVGSSSPPIQFKSVLFPEPDSPITAANSPFSREKDTSFNASTRASPVPYTLHSFSTRKISIPFSFLSITSITVSAGRSPRFCRLPASVCLRIPH